MHNHPSGNEEQSPHSIVTWRRLVPKKATKTCEFCFTSGSLLTPDTPSSGRPPFRKTSQDFGLWMSGRANTENCCPSPQAISRLLAVTAHTGFDGLHGFKEN